MIEQSAVPAGKKHGPDIVFTKDVVYDALKNFVREHRYLPTYTELGKVIGCSYKTIDRRLTDLAKDGKVSFGENKTGRKFTILSMEVTFSDDGGAA